MRDLRWFQTNPLLRLRLLLTVWFTERTRCTEMILSMPHFIIIIIIIALDSRFYCTCIRRFPVSSASTLKHWFRVSPLSLLILVFVFVLRAARSEMSITGTGCETTGLRTARPWKRSLQLDSGRVDVWINTNGARSEQDNSSAARRFDAQG